MPRTVLDELLHAVGDVKVAFGTDVKDVAGSVPAVRGKGLLVELGLLPVALEDVGAP